jgi:hypothetical protein
MTKSSWHGPHHIGARLIKPSLILPASARPHAPRDTSPEFGLFVPPEALFPELEATEDVLAELLRALPRDAVLYACAHLNVVVTGTGHPDIKPRQEKAISLMCTGDDLRRINEFAASHPGSNPLSLFFRGQLLELMYWAVRYCPVIPDDGTVFKDQAGRTRLLKAAMIASMLWSNRVFSDRLSGSLEVDAARQHALGAFRRAQEESTVAPHLHTTLGRGWALFTEHFPRHYPGFAAEFAEATGLTVKQYFTCVTGLSTYLPFDRADGPAFDARTVASATAYREIFKTYFALESQTPDQFAASVPNDFNAHGYIALRERPVIIFENGRALIIDPVFYSERISIGPLFHLTAKARGDRARSLAIFSAFGKAFEDYSNSILRRMYPDRPLLASRLRAPLEGQDRAGNNFEIDAVLNDVVDLVIIEMKAAWLRDDIVLDDFEKWIEQIRFRYGVAAPTADGKQERPKGAAQLARLVRRILDDNCGSVQSELADARVIYPVLLVHDSRLNAPAYANFLALEFLRLLGPIPAGKRVMPMIVMTIEDLENLESSIDQFSLKQLLTDYSAACPDGLRSFHNFMAITPVYTSKLRPGAQLMESAERLLRHAQRELFPQSGEI